MWRGCAVWVPVVAGYIPGACLTAGLQGEICISWVRMHLPKVLKCGILWLKVKGLRAGSAAARGSSALDDDEERR